MPEIFLPAPPIVRDRPMALRAWRLAVAGSVTAEAVAFTPLYALAVDGLLAHRALMAREGSSPAFADREAALLEVVESAAAAAGMSAARQREVFAALAAETN